MGKIFPTIAVIFFLLGIGRKELGVEPIVRLMTPYTFEDIFGTGAILFSFADVRERCRSEIFTQHPELKALESARHVKDEVVRFANKDVDLAVGILKEFMRKNDIPLAIVLEEPKLK